MHLSGKKLRAVLNTNVGKLDRKRALRLRFRRQLRLQRRQVEEMGAQAEQRLEDDFFKRLERLGNVRRFVASWLAVAILTLVIVVAQIRSLGGYYQVLTSVPGGTYTEGALGQFTNANPIYATDLVDTSVSRLVFAGLVTYDQKNQLVGDLAERWAVNDAGTTYTVKLKPDLVWQDGRPLTAEDVVFTYQVIQNPDARSPLYGSWTGIKVVAIDRRTVAFTLPNPLASFPYSLTTGIVPKHVLGGVSMRNMRSVSFNSTKPVGAGPFQWQALELSSGSADTREEKIALRAFDHYNGGKPKLNGFVVRTFRDPVRMIKSFQRQEIIGMAGLTQMPEELRGDGTVRTYNLPLTAAVMTFFRTQDGVLASSKVRHAMVAATDTKSIIGSLPYATVPVTEPFLRGQLAFDPKYHQAGYNVADAAQLLDQEGWVVGKPGGLRSKNGATLGFNLYYLDSPEYASVAAQLAEQWRAVGVNVKLQPQTDGDFQNNILAAAPSPGKSGGYDDALLYGISVGVDPDTYVYWHSSQISALSSVRLNFSEYKSAVADQSLEAGRTRLDPALRAIKYQPFLQAWQADAPAMGLYQPRFLYITRGGVDGFTEVPINTDAGRFRDIVNWQIRERWVTP